MKIRILLILVSFAKTFCASAQTIPYTGGNGSGYGSISSQMAICPNFLGGNTDGAATSFSAPTICPPFLGGDADGYQGAQKSGCFVLVPVTLITFYGEKESARNILHWKAETDNPLQQFEIEKSTDGIHFTQIGIVAASTNNRFAYLFIDKNVTASINYYRLRIIESSNSNYYSKIIVLKGFEKNEAILYPNPSPGYSTLYYNSATSQTVELRILQMDGKVISTQTMKLTTGSNYQQLDFKNVPAGVYLLYIGDDSMPIKLFMSK